MPTGTDTSSSRSSAPGGSIAEPATGGSRKPVLSLCGSRGIRALAPVGAAVHLRGMALGFAGSGHPVELLVGKKDPLPGQTPAPFPLPICEAPRGQLPGVLRRRRPDWDRRVDGRAFEDEAVIFARRRGAAMIWERLSLFVAAGARIRAEHGAPWCVEVNSSVAWEACWWEGVRPDRGLVEAESAVLLAADAVFVVSDALAALARRRGVAPERIVVLAQGHGLERDSSQSISGPRTQDGPFVLGYEGTWKVWQGLRDAGPALLALAEQIAPRLLVLDLWGDGPERQAAQARWRDLPGIEPRWRGLGDERALSAARKTWHAAWVPLAPWPPLASREGVPTERIADALGEAPPDRWFAPLKLAAAQAAGLPTWSGGSEIAPPGSVPPTWPAVAALVWETIGHARAR